MRLTDDKVSRLTQLVFNTLHDKEIIVPLAEETEIRREIKRAIMNELKIAEGIDSTVKHKLLSYSRKIPEGSPEWEVLYQKFFHEEAAKKGRT